MVFDIQRFSLSDGPGIRTAVFLKGCNLRCAWCHNPESQSCEREVEFQAGRCIGCMKCVEVCPQNAQQRGDAGRQPFDRARCARCLKCAAVCDAKALRVVGTYMDSGAVLEQVLRDRELYRISGGGMTISGGEPLLQPAFATELLEIARKEEIHTAMETAGNVSFPILEKAAAYCDLILFDIKGYNDSAHYRNTGAHNSRIFKNLAKISQKSEIYVRMPLVEGLNDSLGEMHKIAAFLRPLPGVQQVELLPYHTFGEGKYLHMGREATRFSKPGVQRLEELRRVLEWSGKKVVLRGA